MTKPPTVHDVARLSGVSTATVSRYFNGKHDILSPETLERVKKAVQDLNYTPSEVGRSLRLSRSNIVVMLVPDATNFFTADVAVSVESALRDMGRTLVLANTSENGANQDKLLTDAIGMRAEAIILQGAIDTPQLRAVVKQNTHCIFVNRRPAEGIVAPYVGVDNFAAGRAVGEYFRSKGYDNIIAIHGPKHYPGSTSRLDGFLQGCGQAESVTQIECSYRTEDGYQVAQKLFSGTGKSYSIFCGNDMISYGVYRAAIENGLTIPGNVRIFGFDGCHMNKWLAPWLSTVRVRTDLYGPAIARLIDIPSKAGASAPNEIFPFEMILRESA